MKSKQNKGDTSHMHIKWIYGLIEVRTGWAITECTLKINVITTRIVRCREKNCSIPQFHLRELFVCFGRQNRILAEIGHGDSSVQIGLWPNPF